MLILNGKKFAKNDKEFTESLFDKAGSCVGYYKRTKCTVILLDHQKNRIGVINRHGVLCCATLLDTGKYWYSFATIKLIGDFEKYSDGVNQCHAALNGAN